jgi:hypothetical protein
MGAPVVGQDLTSVDDAMDQDEILKLQVCGARAMQPGNAPARSVQDAARVAPCWRPARGVKRRRRGVACAARGDQARGGAADRAAGGAGARQGGAPEAAEAHPRRGSRAAAADRANLLHETCTRQRATRNIQRAKVNSRRATCNAQRAACNTSSRPPLPATMHHCATQGYGVAWKVPCGAGSMRGGIPCGAGYHAGRDTMRGGIRRSNRGGTTSRCCTTGAHGLSPSATSRRSHSDGRATSAPGPSHICAGTEPHLHRDRATSAPGPSHIRTGTQPHPHRDRATSAPGPSHIRTGTEPHLHRDRATSAPGPSHICTGTEPHLHRDSATSAPGLRYLLLNLLGKGGFSEARPRAPDTESSRGGPRLLYAHPRVLYGTPGCSTRTPRYLSRGPLRLGRCTRHST